MSDKTIEFDDRLVDEIARQLAEAEKPGEIAAKDLEDVRTVFCQNWDTAKTVLEVLKNIIPGGGIAIGLVITIGDAAKKQFCNP